MSVSSDSTLTDFHNAEKEFVNGMMDYAGRPAKRAQSGYWRSACYIIGVGTAERFAYFGIASNLITYLTGPLGQPTAVAAASINTWGGTGLLLPLFGASMADSFLGPYRTILLSSLLYILALGLLTTSALLNDQHEASGVHSLFPSHIEVLFFYASLYLMAVGQGVHKPCVLAFGADQFDDQDPEELRGRSSFFNWWYFCVCAGPLVALIGLNYIQDNVSWGLGFGIPCLSMAVSLLVFMLGTKSYRYNLRIGDKCALSRISNVFFKAATNWRTIPTQGAYVDEDHGTTVPRLCSQKFKFLNKALLAPDGFVEYGELCSIREVEEAKSLLNLIPLWATSLPFAVALAQPSTLFTEQAITMDRSITSTFKIPAASLQYIIGLTIIFLIPIYDRVFVPLTRILSGIPSGITKLQRIGIGMIICTLCMVTAALVEKKRLKTALIYGATDTTHARVPMSFCWLIPQYILYGVSEIFMLIGLQELFYDQVPCDLKSVGLSLYLSICGVGSFLSSFLICMIERVTSDQDGYGGWFSDDMNGGHLDYFYWLLAGLNVVGFIGFVCIAKSFSCKSSSGTTV